MLQLALRINLARKDSSGMSKRNKAVLAIIIFIAVLIVDQIIKVWVKTNMHLHESIHVFDWFYISFIENNGAAFGMEVFGKLFLSIFRIVAVIVVCYYIVQQIKSHARTGYIVCLSLVLAGAAGNIVDSLVYGQIFTMSTPFEIASTVDFGNGYAPMLMGKVVDMFYFPIIDTTWPTWMPMVGGEHFVFFSPVFNFADASISCGIVALLIFYRKELSKISLRKELNA